MAFAGQKLRSTDLVDVADDDHVLASDVEDGVAGHSVKASQVS